MDQPKFIENDEQHFLAELTIKYKRLTSAMDRARKASLRSMEIWQQSNLRFRAELKGHTEREIYLYVRRIRSRRSREQAAKRSLLRCIGEAERLLSRICKEFSVVLAGTGINGTEGWTWDQRAALFSNTICLKWQLRAVRTVSAKIVLDEEMLFNREFM